MNPASSERAGESVKPSLTVRQKLTHELKALTVAGLYFATWIGTLLLLKELVLAEYSIAFHHLSLALIGALILSKVVLLLEHVSLGDWMRTRPAWVDVMARTLLYSVGVLVVLVLEKAFEGRREHGGFVPSLKALFAQAEIYHVWANTICLSGALFTYNILSVIRSHLGEGGIWRLFAQPLPMHNEDNIPPNPLSS